MQFLNFHALSLMHKAKIFQNRWKKKRNDDFIGSHHRGPEAVCCTKISWILNTSGVLFSPGTPSKPKIFHPWQMRGEPGMGDSYLFFYTYIDRYFSFLLHFSTCTIIFTLYRQTEELLQWKFNQEAWRKRLISEIWSEYISYYFK